MDDQRLVDLEIRYTHLERQVQELSQVVFAQQRDLDALHKQLRELRGRALDSSEATPPAEKPPHY
jgi:SlyX protein